MGEGHLIIVYYKGQYRIAQYGQRSGGPVADAGVNILEFVRSADNLAKLKASIDKGVLYTPTQEQLDTWKNESQRLHDDYTRNSIKKKFDVRTYFAFIDAKKCVCQSTARETGAEILPLVAEATEPVSIVKELKWTHNECDCLYTYVVDLDDNILEVWCGEKYYIGGDDDQKARRFNKLYEGTMRRGGPIPVEYFGLYKLPNKKLFVRKCRGPGSRAWIRMLKRNQMRGGG